MHFEALSDADDSILFTTVHTAISITVILLQPSIILSVNRSARKPLIHRIVCPWLDVESNVGKGRTFIYPPFRLRPGCDKRFLW